MNFLFDVVEPLPTTELIANYWHFLKELDEEERFKLGPVEIVLKSRAVARGWPVALKNQTLALVTEAEMSAKGAMTFVDISEVSSVSFLSAHLILPFVTAGAISRSPLLRKVTHQEAKQHLLQLCEEVRKHWGVKIYFEKDPTTNEVDELTNLNEVMLSILRALKTLKENELIWEDLKNCKEFHIVNALDMKSIAVTRRDPKAIELAFRFSRALPKNLDDRMTSLFASVF